MKLAGSGGFTLDASLVFSFLVYYFIYRLLIHFPTSKILLICPVNCDLFCFLCGFAEIFSIFAVLIVSLVRIKQNKMYVFNGE